MVRLLALFSLMALVAACTNTTSNHDEDMNMNDERAIIETVNRLFINTDDRKWEDVIACFADTVLLDYTSMAGGEPSSLTPQQIAEAWKGILPGFETTHHQIGNYLITLDGKKADVFCYGTATHFLPNNDGNVWVVVGSYDFQLMNTQGKWKVNKMKFNFKYQDGNTNLAALAQQRVSSGK